MIHNKIKYFYKYLTTSRQDEKWGLFTMNGGYTIIPPGSVYPPNPHPDDHYFVWQSGRKLQEYQVILICQGKGQFESASCPLQTIHEGSVIILFPGEWHRYRPLQNTGWNEYWIGFHGYYAKELMENDFFGRQTPVIKIHELEPLLKLYREIFEKLSHENLGYQQICSGLVQQLLANIWIASIKKYSTAPLNNGLIRKIKDRIFENLSNEIDWHQFAAQLNVSYSWMRKAFKHQTGLSPHQYLLQLRIKQARHLLVTQNDPVKKIAQQTGFESSYYFCRLFKKKTGLTPKAFRVQSRGG